MDLTLSTAMVAGFITILVLDFKGDFADVPSRLGRDLWDHYSTADGFRLACGPPSGCAPYLASWINEFTKLVAAHCDFKFAEATLAATLRIAYKLLNGDTSAEPLVAPSLSLIAELLDNLPRPLIASKDEYLRTAQQKIRYLLRIAGGLFDAEQGFDIYKHLIQRKRCAVLDCTTASPFLAQIIVNLLALQLIFPRIIKREVSRQTSFVLVIDEADQFCSSQASAVYPEGYSPLGRLVKQGREFGIMVVFGMSFLEQCSRFITANTSYHIVTNQSDPVSMAEAARTLLEPNSQQLISSLERGEALYKETMGPVPHAMLIKTDHVPAATMARPEQFDQHSYIPARGVKDFSGLRDKIDALIGEHRGKTLSKSARKPPAKSLSRMARLFLDYASRSENLFAPAHIIFKQMGNLSPATQLAVVRELERAGLVAFTQVRIGKSNVRLQEVTEPGWTFQQKPVPSLGGKGGIGHRHYQHWIVKWAARRGYQDRGIERQVPGTNCFGDVDFTKDGKRHVVQIIAHCDSNITSHVRAALIESGAADTLLFVTATKSQGNDVRARITADPQLTSCVDRIQFDVVETYMKELWP